MVMRRWVGVLLVSALGAASADAGPRTTPQGSVSFSEDAEYLRSLTADLVGAGAANARGWTGRGVTVAVFDTGISGWSSEFQGKLLTGYDAVTGRLMTQSYDTGWHGTFVAGLIAASRNGSGIEGIAYDATLLPIRIANGDGSITLSDRQLANGIRYATGRATVFNNSWNSSSTIADVSQADLESSLGASIQAWREAVAAGTIVVWAAGNDGLSEPGVLASLPTYWSELQAGWVVTVSVDSSGVISSFSNRCGSAAAWCIAAPGEDVVSVYSGGGLVTASGTSFSTPVVSAAAALLQQMWPHLTNAQVLSIMFTTANKTGIYADTDTYGQGLLDLDAATSPVGTTTIATGSTVSSGRTAAAASLAVSSSAYGRSLVRILGDTPLMVLDDYDRDFYASASDFVAPTTHSYDAFRGIQGFGRPFRTLSGGGAQFSIAPVTNGSVSAAGGDRFVARFDAGGTWGGRLAITRGVSSGMLIEGTATDTVARAMLVDTRTVQSPFVSLGFTLGSTARDAWGGAYSMRVAPATTVMLAGFGTSVSDRPSEWTGSSASLYAGTSDSTTAGGLARLAFGDAGGRIAFDVGMVRETGTLLGAASEGAWRMADGASTGFVGVSADLALGGGWSLFAAAEVGSTRAEEAASSMVSDVGTLLSTAYRLGLAKSDVIAGGDRAILTVSQPLHIESGPVTLTIPVGRTVDGSVVSYRATGDVGADGREFDVQAGYTAPLSERSEVSLSGLLRLQPDNVAGAAPEAVAMARYRLTF